MDLRPVALVTGAARRLGRDIALELAAHGWDVALHYRASEQEALDTALELRALGADAQTFAADLSDEAACRALVPAVCRHFGRLQAVVNSAALFEYDDVASFSPALMERHWRSNVAPAVLLAQALHAHCAAHGDTGSVINLLDQKLWNLNPDHLSYTLSKAALQCATTLLAQALAPIVRVNAVAPGLTLGSSDIGHARLAALQAATPLQHGVAAGDVARAARFLMENRSTTGASVLIDAGSHLAPAARDFAFQAAAR